MVYKNHDEAVQGFLAQGYSPEDASVEALKLFPPAETEMKKSLNFLQETVQDLKNMFKSVSKKKVEPMSDEEDEDEEDDEEDEGVDYTKMKKSMDAENDVVDATQFFKSLATGMANQSKNQEVMAKALIAIAGYTEKVMASQTAQIEKMQKSLDAALNSSRDTSFLNLDVTTPDGKKMEKGLVLNKLNELASTGKITPFEIAKYELSGQIPDRVRGLLN